MHAFQLWQTFLENVNPLIRLLHGPTTQSLMLETSANLDSISSSTEALIFAIYHFAAVSLENPECERKFGQPRANLMSKFSHATYLALINANFMKTPDMVVLQALTLYLVSNSTTLLAEISERKQLTLKAVVYTPMYRQ